MHGWRWAAVHSWRRGWAQGLCARAGAVRGGRLGLCERAGSGCVSKLGTTVRSSWARLCERAWRHDAGAV
ncbi:hypothetical protein ACOSP7_019524 [Xanthoceras sorbifolium]